MFLALLYSLIIHQTVFANPYHKYPYAFLLDIGNEELQTNSNQFRVSVPGGSLALRYPAIAEGDTIAHVRVTGIDFDNDLKANIVDGGPGYKYVVIVFMGNPGKAYDAVITVSTLDDGDIRAADGDQAGTGEVKSYKVEESEEDSNDSAETEELKSDGSHEQLPSASNHYDSAESNIDGKDEQLPSASNFYDSAENEDGNGREDESDTDKNMNSDEGVRIEEDSNKYSNNDDVQDYAETNDQKDNDYDDVPKAEKHSVNEDYDTDENQATRVLDRNLYETYNNLKPRLYNYGQVAHEGRENEVDYNDDYKGNEDPVDQVFNDEEVPNDREKLNYANDNSAVAY